jgi:CRISPR-associated protein Cas1
METLYITQENCYVRAEGEHLILTRSGSMISTVPLGSVKTLVIFDSVSLSSPAMDLLLKNGIDVLYMSKWGKLKGRILSVNGGNAEIKLAQCSMYMNPNRRLSIAKSIVYAKIRNQSKLVRKYQYNNTLHDYDAHLDDINSYVSLLESVASIDELMGIEGISAKRYWDCFRHFLKNPVFTLREYRPSPDYVNALLNLGYSFLANEIATCLIAKNFELEIGF